MRSRMRVAVTGTPGVGKTSASSFVRSLKVLHVNDLVRQLGLKTGYDRRRRTKEVDVSALAKAMAKMDGDFIVEGHFAHMLDPDVAIVLRCSPRILGTRLRRKGWNEKKVRENVEAEAVDVILIEAIESVPEVCEVDTTKKTPRAVARAIDAIVAGEREKYRVGNVDWSEEVLSWF